MRNDTVTIHLPVKAVHMLLNARGFTYSDAIGWRHPDGRRFWQSDEALTEELKRETDADIANFRNA